MPGVTDRILWTFSRHTQNCAHPHPSMRTHLSLCTHTQVGAQTVEWAHTPEWVHTPEWAHTCANAPPVHMLGTTSPPKGSDSTAHRAASCRPMPVSPSNTAAPWPICATLDTHRVCRLLCSLHSKRLKGVWACFTSPRPAPGRGRRQRSSGATWAVLHFLSFSACEMQPSSVFFLPSVLSVSLVLSPWLKELR